MTPSASFNRGWNGSESDTTACPKPSLHCATRPADARAEWWTGVRVPEHASNCSSSDHQGGEKAMIALNERLLSGTQIAIRDSCV
jgi:hypothetical protein